MDVKGIIERLRDSLKVESDAALGRELGVTSQTIYYWKIGRTNVDWQRIIERYPDMDWNYIIAGRTSIDSAIHEVEQIMDEAKMLANRLQKLKNNGLNA